MAPRTSSLYVGDLHPDVTETVLFEVFKQVGAVASIRLCREAITRRSLGYAYVNFHTVADAENALESLNFQMIKNKPCRIMWSYRDPSIRKSGVGNVFVKNLPKSVDNKALYDHFHPHGTILSCKVATDENGNSRGYGFVHFEREEEATQAIENLNNFVIDEKPIFVGKFIPKKEKLKLSAEAEFTNVYVKNLDTSVDDAQLVELFSSFGTITKAVVMKNESGFSKGFGFVNFSKPQEAQEAVKEMNGKEIKEKTIYVGKAQKKAERQEELRLLQITEGRSSANLYVKHLEDTMDDEKLKEEFAPFGNITSAKVMRDERGNSRGFGFVCYSTPEEAARGLAEMHGRILGTKQLYVSLAQKRDARRRQLELQYSTVRSQFDPRTFMFPGAGAAPGVPVFYAGAPPPTAGRPPNFIYQPQSQQQSQQPQQGGPRWTGPPAGGQQQSARSGPQGYQGHPGFSAGPRPQRQSHPRNSGTNSRGGAQGNRRGFKYAPNVRNPAPASPTAPVAGLAQPQGSPHDVSSSPQSTFASLPPEERKQRLGETLFSLISLQDSGQAGKITGMLLECMEPTELIQLIESPDALTAKISEAREVLSST